MALTDQRKTVLELVNEVRGKLGLSDVASLSADKHSKVMVNYLNDIIDQVADYADWQELIVEATITAIASINEYEIPTSEVVQHIEEVAFDNRISSLDVVTPTEIRRLQRTKNSGRPNQYSVFGVDSNGNPKIRVYPTPSTSQAGQLFNVMFYKKPPLYTTSDNSVIPPFPSRLLSQGLLAYALLDESGGRPTERYQAENAKFQQMVIEAHNRYTSDTGTHVRFTKRRRK